MKFRHITEIVLVLTIAVSVKAQAPRTSPPIDKPDTVERLAEEVRDKGWIVFCARSDKGDWDLFLCRPDGSRLLNITNTSQHNEAAPQFSRDGRRLLYRQLARDEQIDGNHYGSQGQLVFANSDGTDRKVFGNSGEYAWPSWSPDGKQIACLSISGIFFIDTASRKTMQKFDRKGFFQQLTWSPDGKWLCGVANSFGTGWSIARMSALTGEANAVSKVDCCTPDWFPDGKHIVTRSMCNAGISTGAGHRLGKDNELAESHNSNRTVLPLAGDDVHPGISVIFVLSILGHQHVWRPSQAHLSNNGLHIGNLQRRPQSAHL